MKKIKGFFTGALLIMMLSALTACGNNNAPADESGTVTEENTKDKKTGENGDAAILDESAAVEDEATDGENMTDDAALDNGDTMTEGTGENGVTDEGTVNNGNTEDGTVAQDLGNGVRDLGDGVGNAVEDVGDAVGDVVDGDAETR